MANDWRPSTWGDEVTLEYGKAIRGYSQIRGNYRVFGSNGPIGWTSDALTQGPGVVLGRKGAYRGVEFCREPFWVIDTAYYVVPKNDLDMRWLYYAVKHYKLGEVDDGSPIPSTTRAAVYMLELDVPPKREQLAISRVLGTLDDKIELNRKQNETLEAMARALFKAWFVDFEPVRAKIEGRWQRGQSLPGLPAHLYDLFPDRLVESELGEIPEGWGVEPLATSMDFKEGPGIRNWQYTNSEEGIKFINIRCIQGGNLHLDTANRITEEEANGKYAHFQLQPWDIVVSTSGTLGRSAIVRSEHLPLILNTSVIRFRPVDGKTSFSYLYQYLNGSEFLEKLEAMASGSVQRNFGPMHLKQIEILLPPFDVMRAYEAMCRPIYEQVLGYRSEANSLAQLRDTLLPKLISGELRVPDVEVFLKERGA